MPFKQLILLTCLINGQNVNVLNDLNELRIY